MTAEPVPGAPADDGQVTIVLDRKTATVRRVARRDAAGERPARRTHAALLLRSRQLRHLHGAS